MAIKIDELAQEIERGLVLYSQEVTGEVKKAVQEVAENAAQSLNQSSPRRTGRYSRGWATQTAYENQRTTRASVHNKKRYQLTHLLEHGHAKRGGGRVAARVHIKPVEEKAISELEKRIIKAVEG